MQFFQTMSKIIPYIQVFRCLSIKKIKLIRLSLKSIKYTLKSKNNLRCDVHTLPKKLITKRLLVTIIFGGLIVLMPPTY
jgi:hypothetical protein